MSHHTRCTFQYTHCCIKQDASSEFSRLRIRKSTFISKVGHKNKSQICLVLRRTRHFSVLKPLFHPAICISYAIYCYIFIRWVFLLFIKKAMPVVRTLLFRTPCVFACLVQLHKFLVCNLRPCKYRSSPQEVQTGSSLHIQLKTSYFEVGKTCEVTK